MKREFAVNFTRCLLHSFINVTQFRLSHNTNESRKGTGRPAVRDGPLENLSGEGGGRSTKKKIRAREN